MNYELFIQDLCKKAGEILVNLPNELNGRDINPLQLYSKLIFPKYENDDKNIRVSEQEARFAFCQVFEQGNHGLYYSVETPTKLNYSFKLEDKTKDLNNLKIYSKDLNPSKGKSAQSDLSIFSLTESGFNQIINVEFKAHNVEFNHIKKDFLKLLAEPQHGLFFHLVEATNSGTLLSIIDKYQNSIDEVLKHIKEFNNNHDEKIKFTNFNYYFAICILNPIPSLLFTTGINKDHTFTKNNYKIFKKRDVDQINNWTIFYI